MAENRAVGDALPPAADGPHQDGKHDRRRQKQEDPRSNERKDCVPPTVLDVAERLVPGIPDGIRRFRHERLDTHRQWREGIGPLFAGRHGVFIRHEIDVVTDLERGQRHLLSEESLAHELDSVSVLHVAECHRSVRSGENPDDILVARASFYLVGRKRKDGRIE